MNPTFSTIFGPVGLGGGAGSIFASTTAGSSLTSGFGSGGGAVMRTIFSSTGAGFGVLATVGAAIFFASSG